MSAGCRRQTSPKNVEERKRQLESHLSEAVRYKSINVFRLALEGELDGGRELLQTMNEVGQKGASRAAPQVNDLFLGISTGRMTRTSSSHICSRLVSG